MTSTLDATRLRFIQRLDAMDQAGRNRLLRIEDAAELAALFQLAIAERYTDVAATIEVHGNGRGLY